MVDSEVEGGGEVTDHDEVDDGKFNGSALLTSVVALLMIRDPSDDTSDNELPLIEGTLDNVEG